MATVGSFGIDLGLNTARFEEGLKRAGSGADKFQKGFKTAMVGLAAAASAAALGVGAVFAATKGAIDAASAINDASKAAGIAAETYQAWAYSAQLAGVESDAFAGAMTRANKAVGDAANGTGAAAKVMERLGISVRDANGDVISTERVINQFADAISKMQSPSEKAAAAAALFGREAGPKLVALLEQGSSGMAAAAAEAARLGAVIDADLIAKADEAGDQLDAMHKIVSVQLTSALVSLTPVITFVAQAFANASPHVARFFNILRGGNLDALAGQMGAVTKQIAAMHGELQRATDKADKDVLEGLIKRQEARLRALQDEYGRLMRSGYPQGLEAAAQVPLGSSVVAGSGRHPKDKAAKDEETALDRSNKRWGAFLKSAADDHQDLLDEFAQQSEQAANNLERGLQSNTEVMLKWYEDWEEQSARTADRIADGFERVVFAGFRDGIDGMKDAFKSMLVELGLEIVRSKIKELLTDALSASGGGGSGNWSGVILSAASSIFGGAGGKSGGTGSLKKFAGGGSFTVPGPTAGDLVVPIFRANGGETVTVTPKGKALPGGAGRDAASRDSGGVTIVQHITAPGANQETVAMIRREAAMAARSAVGEIINMRSRGRL